MACNVATLCNTPLECVSPSGATEQNRALIELLLAVLADVAPTAEDDPDTILEEQACLLCNPAGMLKRIQTQVICDGLAEVDCTRLTCYSPEQLETIKLVAICGIVNALSP